jgi:hypothetical protein
VIGARFGPRTGTPRVDNGALSENLYKNRPFRAGRGFERRSGATRKNGCLASQDQDACEAD